VNKKDDRSAAVTTRTENALIVSEVGMSQLSAMDFPEEISCLDDALGILRDCILSLSHSDPLRNKPNLTTELKKTSLGVRRFTGWLVLMLEALEKLSVAHLLVTARHQSRVYHAPEIRWNDSTWAHMCIIVALRRTRAVGSTLSTP